MKVLYLPKNLRRTADKIEFLSPRTKKMAIALHPQRMPAILQPDTPDEWTNGSPEEAFNLLHPFAAEQMRVGEGVRSDP